MTASGDPSSESTSTVRDRAHNLAGRVVDKVHETASQMVGMGQEVNTTAGNQGDGQGGPVLDRATEQVASRLDMGKEYVVETMTGVAQALRQTGQHLREEGSQPMLAQYVDRGAEQVERFGGYLRRRDTGELVADVEGFARRQPMVFAGGAFALGMLAVRFLRSGSQRQRPAPSVPISASHGSPSPGTPPITGRTGAGTTPGAATISPGGYTGAAQAALNRTPSLRPTSPSSGGSGTDLGSGPQSAPGAGTRTPGVQPERPTPRPAATPSVGGASTDSGTPAPTPESGSQPGGGSSSSARPGAGNRNQP
jgi:hypothetical protein